MSLKRKFLSVLILALAVAAFSTLAVAQETSDKTEAPQVEKSPRGQRGFGPGREGRSERHGMRGGDRHLMRGLRGIELTEAQQTQIKSMLEAHRLGNQAQREEMHDLFMKKRDGSITEAEGVRLEQLKNDMRASSEQLRNSILALLTPEQNQQLQQIKAERDQRRQERRQRREQGKEKPTDN